MRNKLKLQLLPNLINSNIPSPGIKIFISKQKLAKDFLENFITITYDFVNTSFIYFSIFRFNDYLPCENKFENIQDYIKRKLLANISFLDYGFFDKLRTNLVLNYSKQISAKSLIINRIEIQKVIYSSVCNS